MLFRFLQDTQGDKLAELHIQDSDLDKKLKTDGVIDLMRKGLRYKHLHLDLFYVRPSAEKPDAAEVYHKNIFNVKNEYSAMTGCDAGEYDTQ